MMKLLIYVIGDQQHGMGHVMRCLVLAEELERRGVSVIFVTPPDTPGKRRLQQAGARVYDFHEADLSWCYRFPDYHAALIDVENGPTFEALGAMRRYFNHVITVNGSGYTFQNIYAVICLSDLIIYQSILSERDDKVMTLGGADYLMVNPDYAKCQPDFNGPIVISMGGGDPHRLTWKAANAIGDLYRLMIVIQGGATQGNHDTMMLTQGDVINITAPSSLAPYINGASLLVGAFGMTSYEAAAAGVPSLLTGWSEDHVKTARELEARGICFSLGLWNQFDGGLLREMTAALLSERESWQKMSAAGKALIDGRGAARVADEIIKLIERGTTDHGTPTIALDRGADSVRD